MAKNRKNYPLKILEAAKNLPYFTIDDLIFINKDKNTLKKILYRLKKRERIISLKKGMYVSADYISYIKNQNFTDYVEFVANIIYEPNYLSVEYVLQKYEILTEAVKTITAITTKKTNKFANNLGIFNYYSIKKELFDGFQVKKKNGFLIAEANLGKALFDFIYLRKNILDSADEVKELRLNLELVKSKDWRGFDSYVKKSKSKKMTQISKWLKNL
ncbi:MAG: hypothetical protein GWP10_07685 [Nitrospiraceae bacterium]|nr:hypothetical protein [Nitrospiraceae bacterium]